LRALTLDETYSINIKLAKLKAFLIKFDTHDIFITVKLEDDGYTVCDAYELLTDFMSISETQVACSN